MNNCCIDNCVNDSRDGFSNSEAATEKYSSLYCEKEWGDNVLYTDHDSFNDELIANIVNQVSTNEVAKDCFKYQFFKYLRGESFKESERIRSVFEKICVDLHGIHFPSLFARNENNFLDILRRVSKVRFNQCVFSCVSFRIVGEVFFYKCRFNCDWSVMLLSILQNHKMVMYHECVFSSRVYFDGDFNLLKQNRHYAMFANCDFKSSLVIKGVNTVESIFKNDLLFEQKIKSFHVKDSCVGGRFIVNNISSDEVFFENVTFEGKVEIKSGKIKTLTVTNSNFDKLADFYGSTVKQATFHKNIFSDFTGFENCSFGDLSDKVTTFMFVTFMSFVNFRRAEFISGLDLENTNFKETPNFLNIYVNHERTNRETFRIIKYSFDKVGNQIEANKYFSLEMKSYKKELKSSKVSQEKIVFILNDKISSFGQSYMRPFLLILFFSILFQFIIYGYESNFLYKVMPSYNNEILYVSRFFNKFALSFMPFSKFLYKGVEFISLVFYCIYATLIWQLVVSIKMHTRRS